MFGWLTFYHQGHEVAKDFKPYMTELQYKIQKVSSLFVYNKHIKIYIWFTSKTSNLKYV